MAGEHFNVIFGSEARCSSDLGYGITGAGGSSIRQTEFAWNRAVSFVVSISEKPMTEIGCNSDYQSTSMTFRFGSTAPVRGQELTVTVAGRAFLEAWVQTFVLRW